MVFVTMILSRIVHFNSSATVATVSGLHYLLIGLYKKIFL